METVRGGSNPSSPAKCTIGVVANIGAFQASVAGSSPVWCSI